MTPIIEVSGKFNYIVALKKTPTEPYLGTISDIIRLSFHVCVSFKLSGKHPGTLNASV